MTKKTVTDKLSQAKQAVRLAKAELKKARKRYKAAKKAAKLSRKARKPAKARKPVKARATARPAAKAAPKQKPKPRAKPKAKTKAKPKARAQTRPAVKKALPVVAKRVVPSGYRDAPKKPRVVKTRAPELRSTEEVTKTVIARLHNPPPALPPDPVIPES